MRELKEQIGLSVPQLREAGFSADNLEDVGFTATQLREGGYPSKEIITTWVQPLRTASITFCSAVTPNPI